MGLIRAGMRTPYSNAEALVYDRIVAPAVDALRARVQGELLAMVPRGARILDVGCGGGHLLLAIAAERNDVHATGVDLNAAQVARANARAEQTSHAARVRFVEGSALELAFDDERFDVVMSVASIKHWPDPMRGLTECVRVLRRGGLLAVFEADRGCRHDDVVDFVSRWRMPAAARPLGAMLFRTFVAGQSFDLDDARAMLDELSLENASVRRIEGTPGWLMQGWRRHT